MEEWELAEQILDEARTEAETTPAATLTPGGTFILDTPPDPIPIWGRDTEVLLADGEALIIAGSQGTGKTTLAQQLALGRIGLPYYGELLGYPVTPGQGRTLYLAMDRPRQAARSFRRMVGEEDRGTLDKSLTVWQGPPPADLARYPNELMRICDAAYADTVIVDSLKDAAIGLTDDEVGAGWNRARQIAIAAGVQVIELHHPRKANRDGKAGHHGIDELYGSTWITSGVGSVILLSGHPGDPIVTMRHLKQPATEVPPMKILHNEKTGQTTIWNSTNLHGALAVARDGLTAIDAARLLYDTDKPTPSEKEKARRALDKLTREGHAICTEEGDVQANRPARWASTTPT